MASSGKREVDMLGGSLVKNILIYSFPLIVSNLLQVLYSAADMIVVALSGAEGAIGAIGTTGTLITLVVNLFIGFSVGANAVVARRIGARDRIQAERSAHTAIVMAVLFGLLGAAVGIAVSRPALAAMGAEGEILRMSNLYSVIRFAGVPFMSLTNFSIAIYRARGDTRTPLLILSLSGLANVLMNLFFVLVLHMDVDGVALATVLSQVLSAFFLLRGHFRYNGWCRLSFRNLRIDWHEFWEILRVGVPAGVQGALYSISNLIISSSVISVNNALCPGGSAILDGNSAAINIGSFITTVADALNLCCVTFISQHLGAKKYRRMGKVFLDFFLITEGFMILLIGLIALLRIPLLHLYVTDPAAIDAATLRLRWVVYTYPFGAAMSLCSGMLRGLDKSLTAATITLIFTCVLRIVWIYTVFARFRTLTAIYVSYPISFVIAAALHFIFSMVVWNRLKRENPEPALKGV